MKAVIESWLTRRWYGDGTAGLGLRAMAGVYRVLSTRPGAAPVALGVPVVVVGNFTVGGTGKTPLTIALVRYLQKQGRAPGILSRGHGRRGKGLLRVQANTPVADCGDEPRLMFEQTGAPVFVAGDRVAAGRAAVAAGCNVLVADDGLQHRRLAREVEIEVVDGTRGYGNGLLLPAGPLRERPRACAFRVVNGGEAGSSLASRPGDWAMAIDLGDAWAVLPTGGAAPTSPRALSSFASSPVHAVAAIGNPERFFRALECSGMRLHRHAFEDHHQFIAPDFAGFAGPILMTAKDAVKCGALGLADAWAVAADARLPDDFFEAVTAALDRHHVQA